MKKQAMIANAVTSLILAAVFTLSGCGSSKSSQNVSPPVPPGPKFNYPSGIIAVSATELYVADTTNHTIRKVVIDTIAGKVTVSTIAGKASTPGKADDTDADPNTLTSRFRFPMSITTDGAGNLYVADTNNHTIRQIVIATGDVTTLAGAAKKPGSNPATDIVSGADARFRSPMGIVYGGPGILYVADTNNHTIRKVMIDNSTIPPTVTVSTIAGTVEVSGYTDGTGDGTGTAAQFHGPIGVAADSNSVYVGDTQNHTIRKIDLTTATRDVTTPAGIAKKIGHADGGTTVSTFFKPAGIVLNGNNLFIADQYNQLIRVMNVTTNDVTTLAGTPERFGYKDGTTGGTDKILFAWPQAITTLDGNTLYVADTFGHNIRRMKFDGANWIVERMAGVPGIAGSKDGDVPDVIP